MDLRSKGTIKNLLRLCLLDPSLAEKIPSKVIAWLRVVLPLAVLKAFHPITPPRVNISEHQRIAHFLDQI
jgi:hypothetical protein